MERTESTESTESAGFLAAWNAPITERRGPAPVYEETPGFLAAWNAPITTEQEHHQAPAMAA